MTAPPRTHKPRRVARPLFEEPTAPTFVGKAPTRPTAVLAFDAAWGGTGWAVATKDGPRAAGHGVPSAKRAPLAALVKLFDEGVEALRGVVAPGAAGAGQTVRRMVIEEPPDRYAGRGNQFVIGRGLGRAIGALELAALQEMPTWQRIDHGPHEAELVNVAVWRAWWHPLVHGPGAENYKGSAIKTVVTFGWGHLLPADNGTEAAHKRRGDVAEAILLAVGRARHATGEGE